MSTLQIIKTRKADCDRATTATGEFADSPYNWVLCPDGDVNSPDAEWFDSEADADAAAEKSDALEAMIQAIYDDGSSIYTNDAGQGCGGPGILDGDALEHLLDSGDICRYQIVEQTHDGLPASTMIKTTLQAHGHDTGDGTEWLLAERVVDNGQSNPYRHYLILWDPEA